MRGSKRARSTVGVGAPDRSLTAVSGMAAITELCERLDVINTFDGAVGRIKTRNRGLGAGGLLVGLAAAQLSGQDHLVGLDRLRDDVAGQELTPGAGAGFEHRGGAGPADRRRGVGRGGERGRGGDRSDARAAPGRAGRVAARAGHHRHGHHRCGGLRPGEGRGGRQLSGPAGRAPARGDLGRDRGDAGRGPAGRQPGPPPGRGRAAAASTPWARSSRSEPPDPTAPRST